MNIEGSEIFALRGAQNILKTCIILQEEFSPIHIRDTTGLNSYIFCDLIFPHFKVVYFSKLNKTIKVEENKKILSRMFDKNINEDPLIFSKNNILNIS